MHPLPNLYPFCRDPFSLSSLFDAANADPFLQELLAGSAEVWENYTVSEHTQMVLGMFERYWARFYDPEERAFWRLFFFAHDIGKPIAAKKFGSKDRQHETTWPVMEALFISTGKDQSERSCAFQLLNQDILGMYFKDRMSLRDAVTQLRDIQRCCEWTAEETIIRMKTFFCCDAGAYTTFAGGKYSLDYLFEVDEALNTMTFSHQKNDKPEYQQFTTLGKFEILHAAFSTASIAGSEP
jgi:hypothetical protein